MRQVEREHPGRPAANKQAEKGLVSLVQQTPRLKLCMLPLG